MKGRRVKRIVKIRDEKKEWELIEGEVEEEGEIKKLIEVIEWEGRVEMRKDWLGKWWEKKRKEGKKRGGRSVEVKE